MARTRTDSIEHVPPLRLRIPASLAVALVGASASVAMSIASCEVTPPVPPPELDAGQLSKVRDGGVDSVLADGNDHDEDAATPGPIDAYVPPDTPTG